MRSASLHTLGVHRLQHLLHLSPRDHQHFSRYQPHLQTPFACSDSTGLRAFCPRAMLSARPAACRSFPLLLPTSKHLLHASWVHKLRLKP